MSPVPCVGCWLMRRQRRFNLRAINWINQSIEERLLIKKKNICSDICSLSFTGGSPQVLQVQPVSKHEKKHYSNTVEHSLSKFRRNPQGLKTLLWDLHISKTELKRTNEWTNEPFPSSLSVRSTISLIFLPPSFLPLSVVLHKWAIRLTRW